MSATRSRLARQKSRRAGGSKAKGVTSNGQPRGRGAVHGTGGLWIVDARGVGEPRRIADGTIGGIDW